MAFNMFPFTNLHNLNTDWILKTIKELKTATEQAAATVAGYATRLSALEDSVVKFVEQQLSPTQKQQARVNIDAAPAIGVVYYNQEQSLSSDYKALARDNIGAAAAGDVPTVEGVVKYNEAQSLTDGEKTQARSNIGAAAASAIPDVSDVLRYSSQSLTTGQKQQARENIEAMSSDVDLPLEVKISYNNGYSMDQDMDDILHAIDSGLPVVITCEEVSSWPGFSGYTNLRNVSITQLRVIRSGSSDDFDIIGDGMISYDDSTNKAKILHLSLSISSSVTTIYPTVNILEGLPTHISTDNGKWLHITDQGALVWANLPVYTGGVI